MAYENAYVHHADEEIDHDIIFGRKDPKSKPLKLTTSSSNHFFASDESTHLSGNDLTKTPYITEVPYMIFKVADPNMRGIPEEYRLQMPYSNWTETKFFKAE